MGLTFKAGSSAQAPNVEAGMYDMRFDGVEAKTLEKSQFDPEVFIWKFTLFDDGKVVYDEGEPVEVDKVTSQSTNTKSKTTPGAVKVLKALMTAEEFSAFEREEPIDADALLGRMVQGQVIIKDNGWPGVEEVLPARRRGRNAA
jgi:hypothetical protein